MQIIRYILFIPAAVGAAWLAWLVITAAQRFAMGLQGVDVDSFFARALVEFTSHAAMGAAFVYAGAKVCPSAQPLYTYALAGLALVLAGVLLSPAILLANYWAIWAGLSAVLGIGAITYAVYVGEIEV